MGPLQFPPKYVLYCVQSEIFVFSRCGLHEYRECKLCTQNIRLTEKEKCSSFWKVESTISVTKLESHGRIPTVSLDRLGEKKRRP